MYSSVFFSSFFLNLFLSLFFLLLNLLLSANLNFLFKQKKIFQGFNYSYLFSFYCIFIFDCLIFNILILLNLSIKYFYFYLLIKLFLLINFFFKIKKINTKINFQKINFEFKIIIFLFFVISFFPVSDADSIAIHLNYPIAYFFNFENLANSFKYHELSLYFNSEVLLINSILFKSSNIGSLINITSIAIFLISSIKSLKKNNFFVLFFSTPLILFLLNTQKLQVFFAVLYLVIFIFVYETNLKKIKKIDLFILSFLIIFYISGKVSYVLLALPLVIYTFIKLKKLIFFQYLFFATGIILAPLLIKKILIFGDPIAPFLSEILNSELELKHLKNIISNQGWRADNFQIVEIFKFFIPFDLSTITISSGIGFLYVLYKSFNTKLKDYFYISICGIALIYLSGQILIRFYFESILILYWCSYYKINKIIFKLLKLQCFFIIIILFSFLIISINSATIGIKNFLKQNSYTYFDAKNFEALDIMDNILLLDVRRDSIFYGKNLYPNPFMGIEKKNITNFDKYFVNKMKKNNIKYVVSKNITAMPKCIELKKIKSIETLAATRNFLKKNISDKKFLYLINYKKCN